MQESWKPLDAIWQEGMGREKLARLAGCHPSMAKRFIKWKKKALGIAPPSPPPKSPAPEPKYSFLDSLPPHEVEIIRKSIQSTPAKHTPHFLQWSKSSFKFAFITDTHIGHKLSHRRWWDAACDLVGKEQCDFALHAGDITEGMSGRPGHVYELDKVGISAQVQETVDRLRQFPVKLQGITGNHDLWSFKTVGADPGAMIAEAIPDKFEYLGMDESDIEVQGVKIKLWHGGDGSSYACHDDETEIMTPNGWVRFAELQEGVPVATLHPGSHAFEWQVPTAYTAKHYEGELLRFKSRCVDMMLTPNHRMYVRRYPLDLLNKRKKAFSHPTKSHGHVDLSWQFIRADEVAKGRRQQWQMTKKCTGWEGQGTDTIAIPYRPSKNNGVKVLHFGTLPVKDVAELIAWYVTEGHIRGKGSLTLAQHETVNPVNFKRIWELVERIGLNPCYGSAKQKKDIRVGSMELCEYLLEQCGHMSRHKHLPLWLKNQPEDVLRVVFDTMIAGDGWLSASGFGYKSISKQLLEDFGEVAIKLGYGVTFCTRQDTVMVSEKQTMPTINDKPVPTPYSGMVYCVTVPNGIIMTRRNGKTIWGGNTSYRTQKFVEGLTGGEKPHILLSGHAHKSIFHCCRNVMVFEGGTLCGQTGWMRGKKLAAHCGFWIVEVWPSGDGGIERISPTWVPFFKEG